MEGDNRESTQLEEERMDLKTADGTPKAPGQVKRDGSTQLSGKQAESAGVPARIAWTKRSRRVAHRLVVIYRRASTRAAGLILNTLDGLVEMAPGRN